jgi:hypothetical protein
LKKITTNYTPNSIFNIDKTGLYYRMMPYKTLAIKGDSVHRLKHDKERITVLIITKGIGIRFLYKLIFACANYNL